MWKLLQLGMVGPLTHYIPAYNNYAMLHHTSGSKKKPDKMEKIFSSQLKVMTLKDPTAKPDQALQSALQLGMPKKHLDKLLGALHANR